jgi:hypothetical protein
MHKRNFAALFIFLLVCAAIIGTARITDNSCAALQYYRMMGNADLVPGFTSFIIKLALLTSIVVLLFLLRKKQPRQYHKLKIPLAIVLPFFIFHGTVLAIPQHIRERAITAAICSKSNMEGTPIIKDLSLQEYFFVRAYLQVLPTLPKTANHIDVSFYGDEFLGDYRVQVHFQCSITSRFPQNTHWLTLREDTAAGIKYMAYEDSRQ